MFKNSPFRAGLKRKNAPKRSVFLLVMKVCVGPQVFEAAGRRASDQEALDFGAFSDLSISVLPALLALSVLSALSSGLLCPAAPEACAASKAADEPDWPFHPD